MRVRHGVGIAEAAKRAGISAGFLSSIERAQANASVATLQRLATAYGTTVMELFQAPKGKDRLVKPADRRVLDVHSGVRMELLSTGATMLQSMIFRVAPSRRQRRVILTSGRRVHLHDGGDARGLARRARVLRAQRRGQFLVREHAGSPVVQSSETEAVLLWINTPPTF